MMAFSVFQTLKHILKEKRKKVSFLATSTFANHLAYGHLMSTF